VNAAAHRVRVALAFVAGIPDAELEAAVARYPRPLVELKTILSAARAELEQRDSEPNSEPAGGARILSFRQPTNRS
jgi:hypothetical protein